MEEWYCEEKALSKWDAEVDTHTESHVKLGMEIEGVKGREGKRERQRQSDVHRSEQRCTSRDSEGETCVDG